MKLDKARLQRMYEENEVELKRLDEIEEGYHQNPELDVEKRIRLLLTIEQTRQSRLTLRERLKQQLEDEEGSKRH